MPIHMAIHISMHLSTRMSKRMSMHMIYTQRVHWSTADDSALLKTYTAARLEGFDPSPDRMQFWAQVASKFPHAFRKAEQCERRFVRLRKPAYRKLLDTALSARADAANGPSARADAANGPSARADGEADDKPWQTEFWRLCGSGLLVRVCVEVCRVPLQVVGISLTKQ